MSASAVERIWHIQDSHSQILALAFKLKALKPCKLFNLCSEADPHHVPAVCVCVRERERERARAKESEREGEKKRKREGEAFIACLPQTQSINAKQLSSRDLSEI